MTILVEGSQVVDMDSAARMLGFTNTNSLRNAMAQGRVRLETRLLVGQSRLLSLASVRAEQRRRGIHVED